MTTHWIFNLADQARCINDDDWGSPRQIAAENIFFDRIRELISAEEFEQLETYCLKATTDEMIDEALKLVARR
jgi:hypothetical protein